MSELSRMQRREKLTTKTSDKIQELKDKIALIGNIRKILGTMGSKGKKASQQSANRSTMQGLTSAPLLFNPVRSIRRDGPNVHLVMQNMVKNPSIGSHGKRKWPSPASGTSARATTTPTKKLNVNYFKSLPANLKKSGEKVRRFESKKGVILFPDSAYPRKSPNYSFGAPVPMILNTQQSQFQLQNLNSMRKFGFKRPLPTNPYPLFMQVQKRRRKPSELTEKERWYCKYGCGKFYRRTSSRSIAEHSVSCHKRPADADSTESSKAAKIPGTIKVRGASSVTFTSANNSKISSGSSSAGGIVNTSSVVSPQKAPQRASLLRKSEDSLISSPAASGLPKNTPIKQQQQLTRSTSKTLGLVNGTATSSSEGGTESNSSMKADPNHDKMLEDWFTFSESTEVPSHDGSETRNSDPCPTTKVESNDGNDDGVHNIVNMDPLSGDSTQGLDELNFPDLQKFEDSLADNSDNWLI
mmetsp:Transcript_41276/g.68957  ORF Transcript_41276/g.68957 Transcript_41276/m.68957 type:complete len:469 (+) Transcript_41276:153-1559(+)